MIAIVTHQTEVNANHDALDVVLVIVELDVVDVDVVGVNVDELDVDELVDVELVDVELLCKWSNMPAKGTR